MKVIPTPLPPTGERNVSYVSNGVKDKVCFRVIPCRLNPEVSTYDSNFEFSCVLTDQQGNPSTSQPAVPKRIKGKLAWCVSVSEPPPNVVDDTKLNWEDAEENAACKAEYGPNGRFWLAEEEEVP
jgi:hypothetical protein